MKFSSGTCWTAGTQREGSLDGVLLQLISHLPNSVSSPVQTEVQILLSQEACMDVHNL